MSSPNLQSTGESLQNMEDFFVGNLRTHLGLMIKMIKDQNESVYCLL